MSWGGDVKPLRDTLAALHQAQAVREREMRGYEKEVAARVVEHHADAHQWPDDDLAEVLGALGLVASEDPA